MRKSLLATALGAVLLLPLAAKAEVAFTADSAPMRAGPGMDYPRIDRLPPDARIWIHGCVDAFDWCDVTFRDERGWVPGDRLFVPYEGRRVHVYDVGPRLDLPIIAFRFDDYWGEHYRDHGFYRDRGRWRDRAPERHDRDHDGGPNRRDRHPNDHHRD